MEVRQILEKEVLNVEDIKTIFGVGKNLAYKTIRQIKSVSDRIGIVGKVHRKDYEDYINRKLNY